jgi:hypothetical protein
VIFALTFGQTFPVVSFLIDLVVHEQYLKIKTSVLEQTIHTMQSKFSCNDNIKGVGNLSSPGCSEINVMSLFNT